MKRSKSLGAQSRKVKPVNLRDCPEECDETIREAKFALRSTDLGSWTSFISSGSSGAADGSNTTNSTIFKRFQHWSLVVHFPGGDKTYLFEDGKDKDTGLLEASRTENVDTQVFDNAMYLYFGTFPTSPRELLELAKQVKSNGTPYNLTTNNCQTWLKQFLQLISPDFFNSFQAMLHKYTVRTTIATGSSIAVIFAALAVGVAFIVLAV
jgi:hypothetical protein